jgi:hypothetical protein
MAVVINSGVIWGSPTLEHKSNSLMKLSSSRDAANCEATQKNSQHFMEPEVSLPCSQEPSTCPYPEPDQSNPYHPIISL